MKRANIGFIYILLWSLSLFGQNTEDFNYTIDPPVFDARVSIGFNYDFLRSPLDLSFDYPKGYLGLNLPLKYGIDKNMAADITEGIFDSSMFTDGEEFEPTASAKQYANTTVRVDVPLWGGVASFSNVQNFYLRYGNTLGEPNMSTGFNDTTGTMGLFLRGMISVPMDFAAGWETMTFGYAYKINDMLKIALNLNRHMFRFDLSAKVDIDLRGYVDVSIPELENKIRTDLNYSSEDVYGSAKGRYKVEVWTPTFGIKFWRFGLTSRFGFNTASSGQLVAKYVLPFFIDPETMQVDEFTEEYLMDNQTRFRKNETDSIEYTSNSKLRWRMPHAHTIAFDIIPDKLSLSYTKVFGDVYMGLDSIITRRFAESGATTVESIDFSMHAKVDHIIMLHGLFRSAFINLGIFSMDFDFMEKKDLLENALGESWPVYGGGILLPVLNFGTTMGSKIQLLLELDLLPMSALKTGLIYYF